MPGLRVIELTIRVIEQTKRATPALAAGLLLAVAASCGGDGGPAQRVVAGQAPPTTGSGTLLPPAADDDVVILWGDRSDRNRGTAPPATAPATAPSGTAGDRGGDSDGDHGGGPGPLGVAGLAAVALASVTLTVASTGELRRMLYAWRGADPAVPLAGPLAGRPGRARAVADVGRVPPDVAFSLLVVAVPGPRSHHGREAADATRGLATTLDRLAGIPRFDVEVLAVVGHDDRAGRRVADEAATRHPGRVAVVVDRNPRAGRARALAGALAACRGGVVGVFLPGDEPQPLLLDEVDERMAAGAAAVQAPVQPAGGRRWYGRHHAVDRWFWFRSELPYLAARRFMPLATSSAFVRVETLRDHGWDEGVADEGFELGIRLASAGIPLAALDDPDLATATPAPRGSGEVVRAESARLLGTLDARRRRAWRALATRRQRRRARAALSQPLRAALAGAIAPVALVAALAVGAPVAVTLLLALPAVPQMTAAVVALGGAHELARARGGRLRWYEAFWHVATTVPYRLLAGVAAAGALARHATRAGLGARGPSAIGEAPAGADDAPLVAVPAPSPPGAPPQLPPAKSTEHRHPPAQVVDLDAHRQRAERAGGRAGTVDG